MYWIAVMSSFSVLAQSDGFAGGSGTADDPFLIKTPQQFSHLRDFLGKAHKDKHYKLLCDIDVSGISWQNWGNYGWMPIGYDDANNFCSHLDGNNHAVTGLWLNRDSLPHVGIFGITGEDCVIENLGVTMHEPRKGIFLTTSGRLGGLVGRNSGEIRNCYVKGELGGKGMNVRVGGIVGHNFGRITNSYADVVITAEGSVSNSGGLTGDNSGRITNCHATVKITKGYSSGGLTGLNSGGVITYSYVTGTVTGSDIAGGLAGTLNRSAFDYGSITNCYADVTVSGAISAGGLVGFVFCDLSAITNCYSLGNISGNGHSGGIVGENYGAISYCYVGGKVVGKVCAGGIVGVNRASGKVVSCYMIDDELIDGIGEGKFDEGSIIENNSFQMKQSVNFTGFDFGTVWGINEGWTFPYLVGVGDNHPGSPAGNETLPDAVQPLRAYSADGMLYAEGLKQGDEVRIYTIGGQLVGDSKVCGATLNMPIALHGLFIVTNGRQSAKVPIR